MIHAKRLGEVGIVVRDLERSLAWYREHLGFEPLYDVSNGLVIGRGVCHIWVAEAAAGSEARATDTSRDICQRLMSFEVPRAELDRVAEEFPEDTHIPIIDHARYESRIVEDPDGHAIEFYALKETPHEPTLVERIVVLVDIAGFAQLARSRSETEIFRMLDRFYRATEEAAEGADGQPWKYLGDAVLLTFPMDRAEAAVQFAESISERLRSTWDDYNTRCCVRVRADVVSLAWGPMGRLGQPDGIGHGLNQLFQHVAGGRDVSPALWELAQTQTTGHAPS